MMKTIEEMNNVYIGFDFSMNKPAATIYYNKHFYFYFWALKLTDKKLQKIPYFTLFILHL